MPPARPKSLGARRITPQQEQERVSRGEFVQRMGELGWLASPLDDVGEDFHVQIFDGGQPTGLAFDVQLQSSTDLRKHRIKNHADVLRYPLAVKDLLYWKVSATPVLVVLFDTKARMGYWQPVSAMIEELAKSGHGWREQSFATVSIPTANTLDEPGARRLRRVVAAHWYAIVPKPKKLEFSLTFPLDSDAGKNALEAFEHALDPREAVTLEGVSMPRVETPASFRRIYGEEQGTPVSIHIGPRVPDVALHVRVEAESSEGFAAIPHVELRVTKHGPKVLVLSNEHQGLPLVFGITHRDGEAPLFHSHEEHFGRTAHEAKEAAAFLLAASGKPATLRVLDLTDGIYLLARSGILLEGRANKYRHRHGVLEKLHVVQTKIAPFGAFSLTEGLTSLDVRWIDALYRACQKERVERTVDLTFNVQPAAEKLEIKTDQLSVTSGGPDIRMVKTGGRLELLGVEMPLGEVEARVLETDRFLRAVRRAQTRANASGKSVPVSLRKLRVIEEYRDWPFDSGEWEPLVRAAEACGGYFTRQNARDAGYNDVGLDGLVREGRVEPCSSDVFRVVLYPPSEHEDLILLWLQTDRKAVFSHETALALHDLSDILPTRRHIIVPDDWDAQSRRLPIDVVIHRASVPEVDITWRGDVPVTKPTRTVNDCVSAGVPDEIIDQAVAEGIERGLFYAADVERAPRAESA